MDITSFEELLLSTSATHTNKTVNNIEALLKAHDYSALEEVIPQLSKKDVNTMPIMMALVENFNDDIAEMLCDKGLDPTRISDRGNLMCAPSVEFWNWFVARNSVSKDFYSLLFTGAFTLLSSPLSPNDARRTSSAQFARILNQYQPQLCKHALTDIYLEEYILNKHIKNINPAQWEMVRGCVDKDKWEETVFEIDPMDIKDFENLVYCCKQVPMLNALYSEYFAKSQKMHDWKTKGLSSPTGNLKDCMLITSLPANQRANAMKTLHNNKEKRCSVWGNSDLQMLLLGCRDPGDAMEISNSKIQQNLYRSGGYQNFLHMMMSQMGSSCAKSLRQSPDVEQQVLNVLNIMDCHMFVELSPGSGMSAFFKKFPKTLEWTDVAGNNLGHYMAHNGNISLALFDVLCKNPSLRRANPNGVSPRDILQGRVFTPEQLLKYDQMISKYDKTILQNSLKDVPGVGQKMRTRKSSTRKM